MSPDEDEGEVPHHVSDAPGLSTAPPPVHRVASIFCHGAPPPRTAQPALASVGQYSPWLPNSRECVNDADNNVQAMFCQFDERLIDQVDQVTQLESSVCDLGHRIEQGLVSNRWNQLNPTAFRSRRKKFGLANKSTASVTIRSLLLGICRRIPGHSNKLQFFFSGPYRVLEVLSDSRYRLRDLKNRIVKDEVHISNLRPYLTITDELELDE
jgi:hypothetical protein